MFDKLLSALSCKKKVIIRPKIRQDGKIEYLLNDESTPDLVKYVVPPVAPEKPKFLVDGYRGGGFPKHTKEYKSANCFVTVCHTLEFFNKVYGKLFDRWAGTTNLRVRPMAGMDLNAFYNRVTLSFFYYKHKHVGEIYTANSAEIVAHELGHAILDSTRPDTWNAASLEVWSFHEAFADLTAMLSVLSHDEVVQYVLKETNGNLMKPNIVSNLAEQVGNAIYKLTGPQSGRVPTNLRSAINNFKYVNPSNLPPRAAHNRLAAESHSFGRIFLGAFYDILVMMYKENMQEGMTQEDSLKQARDTLARYICKTIQNVPVNAKFYEAVAKTMLWADVHLSSRKYHDKMLKIFMDRNITRPQLRLLNVQECDNEHFIVKNEEKMEIKLSDHLLTAMSDNELYSVKLEMPRETAYLYDKNGQIMDVIECTEYDSIISCHDMANYLNKTKLVGDKEDTPFEIKDGKLQRTFFN